ncbi:neural cell adhesion molecule 1-B-like [Gigantopelta aegis]|uniref:neural cell adhesion molecule 1-B-like n=1 Tax=Gigantopelta aegis TaxID=1735272 RepID=UPI001B88D83C|nr:neural cell adhesion molecule 1-B-like [Gigantopelta aegis]
MVTSVYDFITEENNMGVLFASMRRSLCLWVYVLILPPSVSDATLVLSGSSSYAVLNQPFTCTVSQAAGLRNLITFYQKTSFDSFASLYQEGASCSVFNPPSLRGYTVSCGSGTNSSSSTTKKYHLRINRTADRDATNWWCDLNAARTRSNTFSLQLSNGPDSVTLSQPPPGSVAEGDSLTVACAASCNPPCSYSWTLDNQLISPNSRLTLTNINRSQTGNVYTCTVTNSLIPKSKTKQLILTVFFSPRLDHRVPFEDRFVTAVGGDVTLTLSVIANPTPTFTWYRLSDGKKTILTPESSTTSDVSAVGSLTLTNVQQRDFGIYQVVVSNGSPRPHLVVNITLVEEGPPSVPSNVVVWSGIPSSLSVAWIEEFNGGLPQTFLVQHRVHTALEWTNVTGLFKETGLKTVHGASISNLQPQTRYLVRVSAYNREGHKGFTPEQEVLTDGRTNEKDNLLGTGIGIGIGIMIGLCLFISGIVFTYWWMRKAKPEQSHAKRQPNTAVQETALYEDMEQTRGDGSSTPANASSNYSSLEARRDAPYDVLRVYDNTSEVKE